MKFWFPAWPLSYFPAPYRAIPRHALYLRYRHSLLFRCPHLPRCKLWLTHPKPTRQRSIFLLHLHLPSHRPRTLLRLVPLQRNLKYWGRSPPPSYRNRLRRLCSPMRTNVLLRSDCHYQPPIRCPLRGRDPRSMNLRWLLGRQCNSNPLLCLPLPPPLCRCSHDHASPPLPTRNRLKQPPRPKL